MKEENLEVASRSLYVVFYCYLSKGNRVNAFCDEQLYRKELFRFLCLTEE